MREVFALRVKGLTLMASAHLPWAGPDRASAKGDRPTEGVGILILNTGYDPRAGPGDFSARLGDELASMGYPVFRLDMPGLGDSQGEIPAEAIDYGRFAREGGFGAWARAAADQLAVRFGNCGMVLLGNCAGAATSIYAAAQSPKSSIRGLVLLEPIFDLDPLKPAPGNQPGKSWGERIRALWPPGGPWWQRLRNPDVPPEANLPLIAHWRRVVAQRIPVLMFTASVHAQGVPEFDYLGYLLSASGDVAIRHEVRGASHTFNEFIGREFITRKLADWLRAKFPLPTRGNCQGQPVVRSISNEAGL